MEAVQMQGIEHMQAESARFVAALSPHMSGATVVGLSGELGAGKTTFVQGVARSLGVTDTVTSPTFVIEKVYALSGQKFSHLIHIDAYRLKEAHELEVLGWKELASDRNNLILIEWPEKVAALIPEGAIRISFAGSGDSRTITYN